VIAVDTNILVYAHNSACAFHEQAYSCMQTLAEGSKPWGIPVGCLHEFLAVVTNPKIFSPPSSTAEALSQIEAWLESPQASLLHSGVEHWSTLAAISRAGKLAGGQFHDARIAATCIENGVSVLWSADRDFSRFKLLKTTNPLI
jgi:uncharacterized protein